jgi:carbonic anhydrase
MANDTYVGSTYQARAPLVDAPAEALVIACSDRRFRAATDEFLSRHLGLRSWESVAVPGGAYMLSFAEALPKQLKVGMRMVKAALGERGPGRIVLIGHQDCARYVEGFSSYLKRAGFSIEEKQKRDLTSVAKDLAENFSGKRVEAHFARIESGSAVFERL